MTTDLSDLLAEGKKAQRLKTIKKAAAKEAEARDKTPLPDGPPIRRDIYQQLDWQPLSLTLVVTKTTCINCGHSDSSVNPTVLLERYHKRHGRHYVELTKFNLLPKNQVTSLPRRIEERYASIPYCPNCFLQERELCLDQMMTPLPSAQPTPSEGTSSSEIPFVPQASAAPSLPPLWSDTFGATWGTTKK